MCSPLTPPLLPPRLLLPSICLGWMMTNDQSMISSSEAPDISELDPWILVLLDHVMSLQIKLIVQQMLSFVPRNITLSAAADIGFSSFWNSKLIETTPDSFPFNSWILLPFLPIALPHQLRPDLDPTAYKCHSDWAVVNIFDRGHINAPFVLLPSQFTGYNNFFF